jgi:excisionase family DNA binding protein
MTPPDYTDWLTKPQAAEAIGVSTKTIEAWAQAKKLQQAFRPQAHGPALAVYHPDDVARLASERQRSPLAPFVVPVPDAARGNGQALAVPAATTAGEELLRQFLGALVHAVSSATTSEKSEKSPSESSQKSFLTIREASALTGLSQAYLRRAIDDGTLPAVHDRGWRIRRKDLEQL